MLIKNVPRRGLRNKEVQVNMIEVKLNNAMVLFRLHRNLISKFNSSKTKFNKWLKNMEKREKNVDCKVEGVEKSFIECVKLEVRFKCSI